jgi:hypothetical protein
MSPGALLEWGEWCGRRGQQSSRGGKMNIVNKKNIFCPQKYFKLLRQIK